ncbi:MAG TPA: MgtC/SapB family protein [Thiobacillaceae bacterium]|nr:MgtC/SapB family protein [Thiobacillaceae bacterium]
MSPFDWAAPDLEILLRYGVALAIGLLMGLERERNPSARAGLRTFALTGLFGVMAAQLGQQAQSPWIIAAGLLLVGIMIIAAYFRQPDKQGDPGTTTISALLVCYGLGALCWLGEIQLAVMLGIASTVLLYFKSELHGISESLTRRDLISILQFAVLALVVFPLLPNRNYGPYGALNPHQIWLMVVLISGVSLAGYASLRLLGQSRGVLWVGLLGGLVSSTATTLAFSRQGKKSEAASRLAIPVILLANLVVPLRLLVLTLIVAPRLLHPLSIVLGGGLAAGLIAVLYSFAKLRPSGPAPEFSLTNPTEIRTSLGFGLLYAGVLVASAWLSDLAGPKGLLAVAAVSGLTDVDAITLSSFRLFNLGNLQSATAVGAVTLALLCNLIFRSMLAWIFGGRHLALHALAGMSAMGGGLCLAWALA